MKTKLVYILLLSIFYLSSQAEQQYKSVLNNGMARWSLMGYFAADAGISSRDIIAYGDTIINGMNYKKMYMEFVDILFEETNTLWRNHIPELESRWEYIFIRENEEASKLFLYHSELNIEYLISDLSLQVGDNTSGYSGVEAVVDSIYYHNGLKHVQLSYRSILGQNLTYVEGFGPNTWFGYFPNYEVTANCFQNEVLFYKNNIKLGKNDCPCNHSSSYVYLNRIVTTPDYNIKIKQNEIEILFSENTNANVFLYDINGNLCFKHIYPTQQTVLLSTAQFSKGMYILKIFNREQNVSYFQKIIL